MGVRFYGVADWRIGEFIEFFLQRESAETFLAECLVDEPGWADILTVEIIEYETSPN